MTLVKTSLLNSIAVAVKIASALVLNKILAVYVGPAGYAIIGQFQNAASIVVSLAGGVVATGVTKATAQHFDDEAKQHAVWQTAIRFSLGIGTMIHYPIPPHLQPAYAELGLAEGGALPISEQIHREVLSLPMGPTLRDEEAIVVCDRLRHAISEL